MTSEDKKNKPFLEEIISSEVWLDPARLPTRLAQRNPLASASLPQFLHHLHSHSTNKAQVRAKIPKRRKPENAVLRYWMDLGDKALK